MKPGLYFVELYTCGQCNGTKETPKGFHCNLCDHEGLKQRLVPVGNIYRFPRVTFTDTNGIYGQCLHVYSEAMEVLKAVERSGDMSALAMELLDVIHSAETALRILEEKHGVNVQSLKKSVIGKNAARGYYGAVDTAEA